MMNQMDASRVHRALHEQMLPDDNLSVQAAQSLVEVGQKGGIPGQSMPYSPGAIDAGMMDEELEELGYMHKDETKLFIKLMSGETGFEAQLQRTRDMGKKNQVFEDLARELSDRGFPKRSIKRLKDKWRDLCSRFRELRRNSVIEEPRWEYFEDMRIAVGFMTKFNSVKNQDGEDDDIDDGDQGDFTMESSTPQAVAAAAMLSAVVAAQQGGQPMMQPSSIPMSSMRKRKRGSLDPTTSMMLGGGLMVNGISLTANDIQNIIRQNGEMMEAARRDRELLLKFVAEDRIAAERRHREVMAVLERVYSSVTNGEMLPGSMAQGQVQYGMNVMGMMGQR